MPANQRESDYKALNFASNVEEPFMRIGYLEARKQAGSLRSRGFFKIHIFDTSNTNYSQRPWTRDRERDFKVLFIKVNLYSCFSFELNKN